MVTVDRLTTGYIGLSTDEKPTGCRNGDTFVEIDTNKLFAYSEESVSNGGGSEATVIYDGDVTFSSGSGEVAIDWSGSFEPSTTPQYGKDLTLEFNGQTYELYDLSSVQDTLWVDNHNPEEASLIVVEDGVWVVVVLDPALMPSQVSPQDVSITITQGESESEPESTGGEWIEQKLSGGSGGSSGGAVEFVTVTEDEDEELTMTKTAGELAEAINAGKIIAYQIEFNISDRDTVYLSRCLHDTNGYSFVFCTNNLDVVFNASTESDYPSTREQK